MVGLRCIRKKRGSGCGSGNMWWGCGERGRGGEGEEGDRGGKLRVLGNGIPLLPIFDDDEIGKGEKVRWRCTAAETQISRASSSSLSLSSTETRTKTQKKKGKETPRLTSLEALTAHAISSDLSKYPSLAHATQDAIISQYRLLDQKRRCAGRYNCPYHSYGIDVLRYILLFTLFWKFCTILLLHPLRPLPRTLLAPTRLRRARRRSRGYNTLVPHRQLHWDIHRRFPRRPLPRLVEAQSQYPPHRDEFPQTRSGYCTFTFLRHFASFLLFTVFHILRSRYGIRYRVAIFRQISISPLLSHPSSGKI
ncbi:hypothetical protein BHYA_0105g00010 [Botrytis hyacinthi]|uniref:Uncharacterized protein n=1 Tax=Botrytis hyacinthi TaxID=278943 RepID=A0A4Z1GJK9_9HELO|nr:hypothetical protein BHYA_0105g00010 [Botrytis hyacinthi]